MAMRVWVGCLHEGYASPDPVPLEVRAFDTVAKTKATLRARHGGAFGGLLANPQSYDLYLDGRCLQDSAFLNDQGAIPDGTLLLAAPRASAASATTAAPAAAVAQLQPSPSSQPSGHLQRVGPTYWPPRLVDALAAAQRGFEAGYGPRLTDEGEGGTYFLVGLPPPQSSSAESDDKGKSSGWRDDYGDGDGSPKGEYVACFKPRDEEQYAPLNPRDRRAPFGTQGSRVGVPSGDAYAREIAAYLLDHGNIAGVPPTGMVESWHQNYCNGWEDGSGNSNSPVLHNGSASAGPHQQHHHSASAHGAASAASGKGGEGAPTSVPPSPSSSSSQPGSPHLPVRKVGSFQLFVKDAGKIDSIKLRNTLPDYEVQKIALLDLRLLNLDRNDDNLLVKYEMREVKPAAAPASQQPGQPGQPVEAGQKTAEQPTQTGQNDGQKVKAGGAWRSNRLQQPPKKLVPVLVPIDHGFIIPTDLGVADCDWVWLDWPQVRRPLVQELSDYVRSWDVEADIARLRAALGNALQPECYTTLRLTYSVIQRGVASGMCLGDIADLMCRTGDLTKRSAMEEFVETALSLAHLQSDKLQAERKAQAATAAVVSGPAVKRSWAAIAAAPKLEKGPASASSAKPSATSGSGQTAPPVASANDSTAASSAASLSAPSVATSAAAGAVSSSAGQTNLAQPSTSDGVAPTSAAVVAAAAPVYHHVPSSSSLSLSASLAAAVYASAGPSARALANTAAFGAARAASAVQGRQRARMRVSTLSQLAPLLGLNPHSRLCASLGLEVAISIAMSSEPRLLSQYATTIEGHEVTDGSPGQAVLYPSSRTLATSSRLSGSSGSLGASAADITVATELLSDLALSHSSDDVSAAAAVAAAVSGHHHSSHSRQHSAAGSGGHGTPSLLNSSFSSSSWTAYFGMQREDHHAVTAIGIGAAWHGQLLVVSATPRGRDVVLLEDEEVTSGIQAALAVLLAQVAAYAQRFITPPSSQPASAGDDDDASGARLDEPAPATPPLMAGFTEALMASAQTRGTPPAEIAAPFALQPAVAVAANAKETLYSTLQGSLGLSSTADISSSVAAPRAVGPSSARGVAVAPASDLASASVIAQMLHRAVAERQAALTEADATASAGSAANRGTATTDDSTRTAAAGSASLSAGASSSNYSRVSHFPDSAASSATGLAAESEADASANNGSGMAASVDSAGDRQTKGALGAPRLPVLSQRSAFVIGGSPVDSALGRGADGSSADIAGGSAAVTSSAPAAGSAASTNPSVPDLPHLRPLSLNTPRRSATDVYVGGAIGSALLHPASARGLTHYPHRLGHHHHGSSGALTITSPYSVRRPFPFSDEHVAANDGAAAAGDDGDSNDVIRSTGDLQSLARRLDVSGSAGDLTASDSAASLSAVSAGGGSPVAGRRLAPPRLRLLQQEHRESRSGSSGSGGSTSPVGDATPPASGGSDGSDVSMGLQLSPAKGDAAATFPVQRLPQRAATYHHGSSLSAPHQPLSSAPSGDSPPPAGAGTGATALRVSALQRSLRKQSSYLSAIDEAALETMSTPTAPAEAMQQFGMPSSGAVQPSSPIEASQQSVRVVRELQLQLGDGNSSSGSSNRDVRASCIYTATIDGAPEPLITDVSSRLSFPNSLVSLSEAPASIGLSSAASATFAGKGEGVGEFPLPSPGLKRTGTYLQAASSSSPSSSKASTPRGGSSTSTTKPPPGAASAQPVPLNSSGARGISAPLASDGVIPPLRPAPATPASDPPVPLVIAVAGPCSVSSLAAGPTAAAGGTVQRQTTFSSSFSPSLIAPPSPSAGAGSANEASALAQRLGTQAGADALRAASAADVTTGGGGLLTGRLSRVGTLQRQGSSFNFLGASSSAAASASAGSSPPAPAALVALQAPASPMPRKQSVLVAYVFPGRSRPPLLKQETVTIPPNYSGAAVTAGTSAALPSTRGRASSSVLSFGQAGPPNSGVSTGSTGSGGLSRVNSNASLNQFQYAHGGGRTTGSSGSYPQLQQLLQSYSYGYSISNDSVYNIVPRNSSTGSLSAGGGLNTSASSGYIGGGGGGGSGNDLPGLVLSGRLRGAPSVSTTDVFPPSGIVGSSSTSAGGGSSASIGLALDGNATIGSALGSPSESTGERQPPAYASSFAVSTFDGQASTAGSGGSGNALAYRVPGLALHRPAHASTIPSSSDAAPHGLEATHPSSVLIPQSSSHFGLTATISNAGVKRVGRLDVAAPDFVPSASSPTAVGTCESHVLRAVPTPAAAERDSEPPATGRSQSSVSSHGSASTATTLVATSLDAGHGDTISRVASRDTIGGGGPLSRATTLEHPLSRNASTGSHLVALGSAAAAPKAAGIAFGSAATLDPHMLSPLLVNGVAAAPDAFVAGSLADATAQPPPSDATDVTASAPSVSAVNTSHSGLAAIPPLSRKPTWANVTAAGSALSSGRSGSAGTGSSSTSLALHPSSSSSSFATSTSTGSGSGGADDSGASVQVVVPYLPSPSESQGASSVASAPPATPMVHPNPPMSGPAPLRSSPLAPGAAAAPPAGGPAANAPERSSGAPGRWPLAGRGLGLLRVNSFSVDPTSLHTRTNLRDKRLGAVPDTRGTGVPTSTGSGSTSSSSVAPLAAVSMSNTAGAKLLPSASPATIAGNVVAASTAPAEAKPQLAISVGSGNPPLPLLRRHASMMEVAVGGSTPLVLMSLPTVPVDGASSRSVTVTTPVFENSADLRTAAGVTSLAAGYSAGGGPGSEPELPTGGAFAPSSSASHSTQRAGAAPAAAHDLTTQAGGATSGAPAAAAAGGTSSSSSSHFVGPGPTPFERAVLRFVGTLLDQRIDEWRQQDLQA